MQSGGLHPRPTLKRSRRDLERPLLPKRELSLLSQNNLVPIGAVEMVIAASQRDAISPTMGHRVVVRGPVISAKEKGMAKERDEEKEKEKARAKVKEDEAGPPDLLR